MRLPKEAFLVDVANQSVEVPDSGGARQSTLTPPGELRGVLYQKVRTVADVPVHGLEVSGNGPCLGWRDDSESAFKWLSYQEFIDRARAISFGLVQIGMKPGQETRLGIYGKNCVEWVLVDHSCHCQSVIPVPLYDSLGPSACNFILNHIEAETAVCETSQQARALLAAEAPSLRRIVLMREEPDQELRAAAGRKDLSLHTLQEVEDLGRTNPGEVMLPAPEDLATICYTSGTTGDPKGVMITHANMVADFSGYLLSMEFGGRNFLGPSDRYLSYLPLAHLLERESQLLMLVAGASIGFSRGVADLMKDLQALRPTVVAAVPRVLNRIYDKVWAQVNGSSVRKFLLEAALRSKKAELDKGVVRNDSLWDRLVLGNVRNVFGGEVRLLVSGGAPIRDEVLLFLRCCLGCPVVQAYGQTECTAAATVTVFGDSAPGVVGPPLPCCFVKLADVPDMGYLAHNKEGEILIKGPNVSRGYFKDPEKTAETYDADGWLHSGDIGRWTESGSLSVIDRKKNLLKLSQGEYVSPERVESVCMASPAVDQIFVDGDPHENCLVAIVVPDRAGLEALVREVDARCDWPALCDQQKTRELLLRDLNRRGKEAGLLGYEQVRALHIQPEPFTMEDGLLTATLKLKRPACRRRFQDTIRALYQELKR